MKNITTISAVAAISALALAAAALPAAARTAPAGYGRMSSTTMAARMASSSAAKAARMEQRMQAAETKGENEIAQRISSLNDLLARVQAMKNVSDAQKVSIQTSIQAEISDLQALESSLSAASSTISTSTLKADLLSITQGHRVYVLVEPRVRILAAADRIDTIASMIGTIEAKIQTRIASTTATSTAANPSIQSYLSDINAKIADATAQTQAAVAEVTPLAPDNGDKNVAASNASALKDARLKLQAAQKDIVAARQDLEKIVQTIRGNQGRMDKNKGNQQ